MRLDSSGAVPMKLHARLHAINIHERKMGCSFLFHQRYLNKFPAFPILKLLQFILPICYPLCLCGEFMLYGEKRKREKVKEKRERERERDYLWKLFSSYLRSISSALVLHPTQHLLIIFVVLLEAWLPFLNLKKWVKSTLSLREKLVYRHQGLIAFEVKLFPQCYRTRVLYQ